MLFNHQNQGLLEYPYELSHLFHLITLSTNIRA